MASSTTATARVSTTSVDVATPSFRPNPLNQINRGGIGYSDSTPIPNDTSLSRHDKALLPGYPRSLSGIALRSMLLGIVFSSSSILTICLCLFTTSSLWRIPFFLATLSTFHFLEFWTTARYNTRAAKVSSFLLSNNGSAYQIAHAGATIECLITNLLFPTRHWLPSPLTVVFIALGLGMILVGQTFRSVAMVQAGTNFNHVVQHQKASEHMLVTTGLYGYLRHPSYFGFFWWGLGTQLVLGNGVCFFAYAIVLWRFFQRRIEGEEELLVAFFGDEYVKFRQTTGVGIPFIR